VTALRGTAASAGVARGPIRFVTPAAERGDIRLSQDPKRELSRFDESIKIATGELRAIHEKTVSEIGEESAAIFEIHAQMLEDDDYLEAVREEITSNGLAAESAVRFASEKFARMLVETGDDYIAARAQDVKDVATRVVAILSGAARDGFALSQPSIIAADDLSPSQTVLLDRAKVLGLVTARGAMNTHTAILARSMGIPAVVALGHGIDVARDGLEAIVDGTEGVLYIEPDTETSERLAAKEASLKSGRIELEILRGKVNRTKGGRTVEVYANAGSLEDVELALRNDTGGIGLFRSEFLYLEKADYPTEEELFSAYKNAAERLAGKKLIVRTLDIGADKQAPYFNIPPEENPAMGLRAIRICLTRPDVFDCQLRAILRASAFGTVAVMFPMISSTQEVIEARKRLRNAMNELATEGTSFDPSIETGIMIETPAAAIISDELAPLVDFFSVGSNDLTQYTLAMDRQNDALRELYDPHHEAVLRLIEMTARNAHAAGIWVGICGELGSDVALTDRFLSMGIDEFSVSPASVLALRNSIRNSSVGEPA